MCLERSWQTGISVSSPICITTNNSQNNSKGQTRIWTKKERIWCAQNIKIPKRDWQFKLTYIITTFSFCRPIIKGYMVVKILYYFKMLGLYSLLYNLLSFLKLIYQRLYECMSVYEFHKNWQKAKNENL